MLLLVLFGVQWASSGPLQLVSLPDPTQGSPAGGSGDSLVTGASTDGRYILFASTANNLVLNGNNQPIRAGIPAALNAFLRDRTNGTTTLISVDLSGWNGGNRDSLPISISADGRFVLFESSASNLVPNDTNNVADIFVRDLLSGTTVLVSASTNGCAANGPSRSAVMTPDARYVAFVSAANNLVPGDTNGISDVFLRDLQSGITSLVSIGAKPTGLNGALSPASESPTISADGRYVAFYSTATNLVAGVSSSGEIYVRDVLSQTTIWASTGARAAVQAALGVNGAVSYNHALSDDGQFVAFEASPNPPSTTAAAGVVLRYNLLTGLTDLINTNANASPGSAAYQDVHCLDMTPDGQLVAFVANTNGSSGTNTCVLVWDAATSTTALASGDLGNNVPAGSICDWPTLDATGRFVVFLSNATNLVANPLSGPYHLYRRDLQSGSTVLVDADTNGVGSNVNAANSPRLSAGGNFIAFDGLDGSLVAGDRNHGYDVFVRDLSAGTTELISAHHPTLASATPNGFSVLSPLSISAEGTLIAFASEADNLVSGDTNGCRDVFVRDRLSGINIPVSVDTNGVPANGPSSQPAISGDGRFVAFTSAASSLVPGDSNKADDVFVRDLQTGTTLLASMSTTGTNSGNGASSDPILSSDGRYLLFRSKASNLAAASFTSGSENLFLRNLQAGTTFPLSTAGFLGSPSMTPDGHFVAFITMAAGQPGPLYVWDSALGAFVYTNFTAGLASTAISPDGNRLAVWSGAGPSSLSVIDLPLNTNWLVYSSTSPPPAHPELRFSGTGDFLLHTVPVSGTNQVYLYSNPGATNLLISQSALAAQPANGPSDSIDLSPDGRFVACRSAATDLVPGDTNGVPDLFLYDRLTGSTLILSVSRLGNRSADNRSLTPVFSADGQTLVFMSWAGDLVPGDFNHNSDVFAYAIFASSAIPLFYAQTLPGAILNQGPWVTWPVLPGKHYQVQFKDDLSVAGWQDLNGNVSIVGTQGYFNDFAPASSQRFYRIVAF